MLNLVHFRDMVIRPTLELLGPSWLSGAPINSPQAELLLIGTALQESNLKHLRQIGYGPALGLFQMEPATHADIWKNYLAHKPELRKRVLSLVPRDEWTDHPPDELLATNMAYAAAMCRVHYYRVSEPLPRSNDPMALGRYWKVHYNTIGGAGTVEEFAEKLFNKARVLPEVLVDL